MSLGHSRRFGLSRALHRRRRIDRLRHFVLRCQHPSISKRPEGTPLRAGRLIVAIVASPAQNGESEGSQMSVGVHGLRLMDGAACWRSPVLTRCIDGIRTLGQCPHRARKWPRLRWMTDCDAVVIDVAGTVVGGSLDRTRSRGTCEPGPARSRGALYSPRQCGVNIAGRRRMPDVSVDASSG